MLLIVTIGRVQSARIHAAECESHLAWFQPHFCYNSLTLSSHSSFSLRANLVFSLSTLSFAQLPTKPLCVCILFPLFIVFWLEQIFVRFAILFFSFVCFIFHYFIPFFSVYLFITDSNAGQREDKTCGDINRETKSR